MAVNINIPSQVKTYANLAAFPATGELKTIYIAEDNNKTYRWTGSVYVEISASAAAAAWGNITGTLSNQTDLQNALNAKENTITAGTTSQYFRGDKTFQTLDKAAVGLGNVDNTSDANKPISTATQTALNAKQNTLTLTTTGTSGAATLVGSTLNIPQYSGGASGITIGTTAITSGTVGRILFEGTGNVVQESGNLFWDNTNGRLGIGTSSPSSRLHVIGNSLLEGVATFTGLYPYFELKPSGWGNNYFYLQAGVNVSAQLAGSYTAFLNYLGGSRGFTFIQGSNNTLTLTPTTYNVLIGTTTDAGFRLDVNGTARVQGQLTAALSSNAGANPNLLVQTTNGDSSVLRVQNTEGSCFITTNNGVSNFTNNTIALSMQLGFRIADGAGGIGAISSAILEVTSTTKGFLPPRMTTTERNAIASPAAGLMVYDTTLNVISYYNGTMWV